MQSLHKLSGFEAREKILAGKLTLEEYVKGLLRRVDDRSVHDRRVA